MHENRRKISFCGEPTLKLDEQRKEKIGTI